MASFVSLEADGGDRTSGRGAVTRAERNLVVAPLAREVAARILREVRSSPGTRSGAAIGLEQAGGDLRERCLAAAVGADEPDDLPSTQLERSAREHRLSGRVREVDGVEPAKDVSAAPRSDAFHHVDDAAIVEADHPIAVQGAFGLPGAR